MNQFGSSPCSTRRVIVVTDGDTVAKRALKMAARRTSCHVVSRSAGSPTPLSGVQIVRLIKEAPFDPVIVMLDDNGDWNQSDGETALGVIVQHPDISIIGALAVASNTTGVTGVPVDFSIDGEGRRIETGVNKDGVAVTDHTVFGDTVDILRRLDVPLIIGIGDIGKMAGRDAPARGSPITTNAIQQILRIYSD